MKTSNVLNRRLLAALPSLLLLLPARADAHAMLEHAEPQVGTTVAASPATVSAHFSQAVEPAFSKLRVLAGDGKPFDRSDTHADPADPATLVVSIPPLPPGTYRVEWKVTSVDTHQTHGSFTFTVQPKN